MTKPFEFKQCVNLPRSTGRKATDLRDLRELIATVSDEAIFHHTCQYFLKGHILEYTNDFAQWVGEALEERALSEQLSNIDPYAFHSIADLREEMLRVIDAYFDKFPEPRAALPGSEFYSQETITIVFPTGIKAKNMAEFLIAIRYIDPSSIYYHFYEARVRLGSGEDDFSKWFDEMLGKHELASRIRAIDPFMHNIEGIREHLAEAIEEEVKKEMESVGGEE